MTVFRKPRGPSATRRKTDLPEGLWVKCPITGDILYREELQKLQGVAPKSQYHFPLTARERVACTLDEGSFQETHVSLGPADPLSFTDREAYSQRIARAQQKTGEKEAVVTGTGTLEDRPLVIAVMDFAFNGGSMGSVVGEKITRSIEEATDTRQPLLIFSASGGARMQEGILSLMQMSKTAASLARHARAKLPYISVLTHPTMAGVMASFASLGDLILAEPGALIGFTGPRVIRETTQQKLPTNFQTAEFLLERGLLDQIVHRHQLRERVAFFLKHLDRGRG